MMQHDEMIEAGRAAVERRAMLQGTGVGLGTALLALAGTAVASTASAASSVVPPTTGLTAMDINILNFALNLEYLDSTYYHLALLGTGLPASDTVSGDGATPAGALIATGASPVPFQTSIIRQYGQTLAADEQAHVRFVRGTLGASAVAMPSIDLSVGIGSAFNTLAINAGIIQPGQVFNPYQDENAFLLGAFVFEDVAVTAYAGSAALLSMGSEVVQYAASILSVEAYHAATIRTLLAIRGGGAATDAIATVRSMLSSGAAPGSPQGDDFGTFDTASGNVVLFPGDYNALAFRRSTQQVLNIVYGNSGAARTPGLFFPKGLNALPGAVGFS